MSKSKLDDLTIGEARQLAALFSDNPPSSTLNQMVGQWVIIRTYSAGVWYGRLVEKSGSEVIIASARRLWRWWAAQSISLSGVAVYGVKPDKSKIAPAVSEVWLEAIEILPCTNTAMKSIDSCENAKAE